MSIRRLLKPENRLEQLLRVWEDRMLIAWATMNKMVAIDDNQTARENLRGAVANWRSFRKFLLSGKPDDKDAFEVTPYVAHEFFSDAGVAMIAPDVIRSWNRTSRRMYCLTEDIQRSLELTSVGRLSWDDIHPPFPAFGITLPIPIPWSFGKEETKREIDFVYVEFMAGKIMLMALGKEFSDHCYITERTASAVIAAVEREDFRTMSEEILKLSEKYFRVPAIQWLNMPRGDGSEIADGMESEYDTITESENQSTLQKEKLPDHYRLIIRLVAGLCLNLEAASRNRTSPPRIKTGAWSKINRDFLEPNMVTAESLVCSVNTARSLAPEERRMHDLMRTVGIREAFRMSVHFRSAHWRKKPKEGNNPAAPKCVHVDWAIVNRNCLKGASLPVGSAVTVGQEMTSKAA